MIYECRLESDAPENEVLAIDLRDCQVARLTIECPRYGINLQKCTISSLSLGEDLGGHLTMENTTIAGGLNVLRAGPESISIENCVCEGRSSFLDIVCKGPAGIRGRFPAGLRIAGSRFQKGVSFDGAEFGDRTDLGPFISEGAVSMFGTRFARGSRMSVAAAVINATRLRAEGLSIRARWADVVLTEAEFEGPSLLGRLSDRIVFRTTGDGQSDLDESGVRRDRGLAADDDRPRLLSLEFADVGNAAVVDVALHACRFAGASGLDSMRIEGASDFHRLPNGRRALAAEHLLLGAPPQSVQWPSRDVLPTEPPTRGEAETSYRALRLALENRGDAPGAGDLYEGEMEMRRDTARTMSWDWAILSLYKWLGGYGVRVGPPLAALAVLVTLGFVGLAVSEGWTRPVVDYWLLSIQSVVSIGSRDFSPSTSTGANATALALKIIGPILIALAVLSFRGRVRR